MHVYLRSRVLLLPFVLSEFVYCMKKKRKAVSNKVAEGMPAEGCQSVSCSGPGAHQQAASASDHALCESHGQYNDATAAVHVGSSTDSFSGGPGFAQPNLRAALRGSVSALQPSLDSHQ